MFVVLKASVYEFDIGISKYSNFESRQFQSICSQTLGLAPLATVCGHRLLPVGIGSLWSFGFELVILWIE